jgi:hypothetical protein
MDVMENLNVKGGMGKLPNDIFRVLKSAAIVCAA